MRREAETGLDGEARQTAPLVPCRRSSACCPALTPAAGAEAVAAALSCRSDLIRIIAASAPQAP
jgi:hypothetical protein